MFIHYITSYPIDIKCRLRSGKELGHNNLTDTSLGKVLSPSIVIEPHFTTRLVVSYIQLFYVFTIIIIANIVQQKHRKTAPIVFLLCVFFQNKSAPLVSSNSFLIMSILPAVLNSFRIIIKVDVYLKCCSFV